MQLGEMNSWISQDFYVNENNMYDSIMLDICHIHLFKPIEYTMQTVEPKENYGLQMIMIDQCGFIFGKNITFW